MSPPSKVAARRGRRDESGRNSRIACTLATALLLGYAALRQTNKTNSPEHSDEAAEAFAVPQHWIAHKIAKSHFPGLICGATAQNRILMALKPFGLTRKNSIYGQSIDPEEVTSDSASLPSLLTQYYGRAFWLGGIGGAPFAGKTGFAAFARSMPDDGNVVLLFGPHIGYSPLGEPGYFLRAGQANASACCGVINYAYRQCMMNGRMPVDLGDMEQSWLRAKIQPACKNISRSQSPRVALVKHVYKAIEQEVFRLAIATDFGDAKVVLIGGIFINLPRPAATHFQPLHFSIRFPGTKPMDLMAAFG